MPKKSSSSTKAAPKAKKVTTKESTKKSVTTTESPKWAIKLKDLRAEVYMLSMKHALRELKEVHKLRLARKAVARFLTQLNQKSHEKN